MEALWTSAQRAFAKIDEKTRTVNCLVRLAKTIETPSMALNHYAVGWALGCLTQQFEKDLYRVKSLTVQNDGEKVKVEAEVLISFTAEEGNEENALAAMLSLLVETSLAACCYSSYEPRCWNWDSAERID